ncbi:helicase [Deinococcus seoulensis]|uniref:Helicase n=1 Tax=Deinococcus seoulensis TaxID=1837379 RepID=A0ABQ2RSE9_9DEIO|nr:helicase-related protein [Deinococcus seoulensis]GGR53207.1 helicase [Deinococcus seoulensis]
MPKILDNINDKLLDDLRISMGSALRADFCVGYFNLRGWKLIDDLTDQWSGEGDARTRLLVGMQDLPEGELRSSLSLLERHDGLDNKEAKRLRRRVAESFRQQLMLGAPSNSDEVGLRRLSRQLKEGKVQVKLFLGFLLHAKLYLLHRADHAAPRVAYVGSSNLTFAGLKRQGELNVDVVDPDATQKLARWFEDRWTDRWAIDITLELAQIIDESWAGEQGHQPHDIYLKMAYHLSREARAGVGEFRIPQDLQKILFPYQTAAVQIAAHHLNKRGGVMLGDVVGLGKTLMATALVRVMQEAAPIRTLIICPVNLVPMWEDYVHRHALLAKVMPISRVTKGLPDEKHYQLVLIDESHNLRNREGKRYRAIQEYVAFHESKVILLSATPYNKSYEDLGAQLRLFVPEDADLGIRPEELIRETGEADFRAKYQAPVRSIAAFEKSTHADDWRDLMRLYLVRRTRSFVQANYAEEDPTDGRRYLTFSDGQRAYFPVRRPRTVTFAVDESDPADVYARLYAPDVVDTVGQLALPRYGLGNFIADKARREAKGAEKEVLDNLGRAGKRLIGFSRTNLFKRLESGGATFVQSLERHVLRNYIFLHALENGKPLPIGPQNAELLDERDDDEGTLFSTDGEATTPAEPTADTAESLNTLDLTEAAYRARAAQVYAVYETAFKKRFRWIRAELFTGKLATALRQDARALLDILTAAGEWKPEHDPKLNALHTLLTQTHPNEKVLVFTQFADTVEYLVRELRKRGVTHIEGAIGSSKDPTELAWRFSPGSNNKTYAPDQELRVLIATDVLSEGQNLQDAHVIVNFDLPWAIIRLIQRAGRVDRIGQQAREIDVYSFLPADGVERLINLRARVRQRLAENAEVVGTDERFFEDDETQKLVDLYNEKSGLLDGETDNEVDLASYAYQIWQNALKEDPKRNAYIPALPDVVYSTKAHHVTANGPGGVLVYTRTPSGYDALAWMDEEGQSVTQSQLKVLQAAECLPDTPAQPRLDHHHDLVRQGVAHIAAQEAGLSGGQLGRPNGARARTYERLKHYWESLEGNLYANPDLALAIDDIYQHPLRAAAADTLSRQLRSGIDSATLAALVLSLRDDDRLILRSDDDETAREPQIICSLGLRPA